MVTDANYWEGYPEQIQIKNHPITCQVDGCTQTPNKDSECRDEGSFVDGQGYGCDDWDGYDCQRASEWWRLVIAPPRETDSQLPVALTPNPIDHLIRESLEARGMSRPFRRQIRLATRTPPHSNNGERRRQATCH